uniref:Ribosome maturation factor RimP n=1 Tax=Ammonifex degensii TaxID=42838 RepID=A0A7C1FDE7_9THEO
MLAKSGWFPLFRVNLGAVPRGGLAVTEKQRIPDQVLAVAKPLAEMLGLEIVDVVFRKEGGRWVLRVFIDKTEGVGLDDCEAFSERLGHLLDQQDMIPHAYALEVSSPGVERPLKKPADFLRFRGREACIVTTVALGGRRKFTGQIVAADGEKVRLLVEGNELEIPYAAVRRANLVFRWQ